MRDDEKICREGFRVGSRPADEDHQIAGKSAQPRVEERACQTAQVKIVRYQFGGGRQDAQEIFPKDVVFTCVM
jgi:hypothetical protein